VIFTNLPSFTGSNQNYNVQDGYIDAWRFVAGHYSNNPAVIGADLYNEPPYDTVVNLQRFYERVGSNVFAVNPKLLLICQDSGSQPATLNTLLAPTNPPGLPNLVYSIHIYVNYWDDLYTTNETNVTLSHYEAHTYLTNYQAASVNWNAPFWVGEFDEFSPSNIFNSADMAKMMQYCRNNAINWSYFAYGQGADKPLVTNAVINTDMVEMLQSGFDTSAIQLSITNLGNQLALSWPTSYFNFVPEWTASLSQTNWTSLTQQVTTANSQNLVLLSRTNGGGFFRLRQ
jgi:hypothetical protein